MTCPDCHTAQSNPRHGGYRSGCIGCEARALAQSPAAWKATHGITATELQDGIDRTWREPEQRQAGKRAVWEWIKLIGGSVR